MRIGAEAAGDTPAWHPQRAANRPGEPRMIPPGVQGETSSPESRQTVRKWVVRNVVCFRLRLDRVQQRLAPQPEFQILDRDPRHFAAGLDGCASKVREDSDVRQIQKRVPSG